MRGIRFLAALPILAITVAAPAVARAQTPPEPSRFAVGGSLIGEFGRESVLIPAVRASFQLTTRTGLDVEMGASTRASDRIGLAPRGFTSAFSLRIGSHPDQSGSRKYFIIGSRTIREGYADNRLPSDTYPRPFFGFGIDRHQPHIRAAGEIGMTGGLNGAILLLGFCVQWDLH
ncbi:MAG TPA: hypothetical protein VN700_03830 [Vicinamibacterales bacterium]|nr:hypothetical protein [Vicinamibacterales bacterium]